MKLRIIVIFLSIFILVISSYGFAREYELLRAPQSSMLKLSMAWRPFLKKLEKDTGISLKLKLFKRRKAFEKYLNRGKYDFLFANPYYSLLVKDKFDYQPIVRSDSKRLVGIIVVSKESTFSITELNGKLIAFPGKNALAASMLVRSFLVQKGIQFSPVYTQSHQNTYLAVLNNTVIAGGGIFRTLNDFKEKSQLKVIYKTPSIAMHPLSVHIRVPEKVKNQVTKFIFNLAQSQSGRKILKRIKLSKPVMVDFNRDYEVLRELKIKNFSSLQL